jgi:RNA 2',3'-cyclic 3'-phosphodiesterase
MRLFIALDIDESIRERIALFHDGVRGFAAEAGWVRPESLHVTLKFIGEKPEEAVAEIQRALAPVAVNKFSLAFRGVGFFPTAKSPRVFWVGIESGPELSVLAEKIDLAMERLDIPRETHPYTPHLTLARGPRKSGAPRWEKGDGPNKTFARLQEKLSRMPTPEFGTMSAQAFFLYQSKVQRGGAQYTQIARFELR